MRCADCGLEFGKGDHYAVKTTLDPKTNTQVGEEEIYCVECLIEALEGDKACMPVMLDVGSMRHDEKMH